MCTHLCYLLINHPIWNLCGYSAGVHLEVMVVTDAALPPARLSVAARVGRVAGCSRTCAIAVEWTHDDCRWCRQRAACSRYHAVHRQCLVESCRRGGRVRRAGSAYTAAMRRVVGDRRGSGRWHPIRGPMKCHGGTVAVPCRRVDRVIVSWAGHDVAWRGLWQHVAWLSITDQHWDGDTSWRRGRWCSHVH